MIENYRKRCPDWYLDNEVYDLILSDDIDSLSACAVINKVKGWKIGYFYDFNGMGKTNTARENKVGVDIALIEGKTFDNHVVLMHNEDSYNQESINLNITEHVTRNNYTNKYCGSTLLLVWSLYNLPLPESEEGKMLLLAIDVTQKGYYGGGKFREMNKYYLCGVLGYPELYEVEQRHTAEEFGELYSKYNLNSKITHPKGILQTDIKLEEISKELGIDIELPTKTFYKVRDYKNSRCQLHSYSRNNLKRRNILEDEDIFPFSLALIYADTVVYSKIL
jgi:hypothetical protein